MKQRWKVKYVGSVIKVYNQKNELFLQFDKRAGEWTETNAECETVGTHKNVGDVWKHLEKQACWSQCKIVRVSQ